MKHRQPKPIVSVPAQDEWIKMEDKDGRSRALTVLKRCPLVPQTDSMARITAPKPLPLSCCPLAEAFRHNS
ncbi:hypothetical protein NDU88_008220 [Pleurodeles waltl]|uniref:Uncharacterized protein n=1 Tax=Pleurodeles waltl TaxID=8319 RepID=A0AAV7RU12_PLEWA|nr:hypothetical protein NDU88_008220 [Pleurodeles waltl]